MLAEVVLTDLGLAFFALGMELFAAVEEPLPPFEPPFEPPLEPLIAPLIALFELPAG
jgi:hypothetical protein